MNFYNIHILIRLFYSKTTKMSFLKHMYVFAANPALR